MTYDLTPEEVEQIMLCMSAAKLLADPRMAALAPAAKLMWVEKNNAEVFMQVATKLDPERAQKAKDVVAAYQAEKKGTIQ